MTGSPDLGEGDRAKPARGPRAAIAALAGAFLLSLPGLVAQLAGIGLASWLAPVLYGVAILGSAFLLAWAAEVLQLDVSKGLALTVLALIAVLPEYAVDFAFAFKAGKHPHKYAPLALANMTGGNRLLIGIGWSLVVLLAAWRMTPRPAGADTKDRSTPMSCSNAPTRSRSAFLAAATLYSLTLPLRRTLTIVDAIVLISIFVLFVFRVSRAPAETPHLVGPAQLLGKVVDHASTGGGRRTARRTRRA